MLRVSPVDNPNKSLITPVTVNESLALMRQKIEDRRIKVLAVLPRQSVSPEEIGEQLGVEEIIISSGLAELIDFSGQLHRHRVVGGVFEIGRPNGTTPVYNFEGARQNAIDLVLGLPGDNRLGRVDFRMAGGLACMAVISREQRHPLLREIIREGANPTALMIAAQSLRPRQSGGI